MEISSFYFKEQSPKRKFGKQNCFQISFYAPKMGKTVYVLVKGKTKIIEFLFILSFQIEILNLRSHNSLVQHEMCRFIFLKNHFTLFFFFLGGGVCTVDNSQNIRTVCPYTCVIRNCLQQTNNDKVDRKEVMWRPEKWSTK